MNFALEFIMVAWSVLESILCVFVYCGFVFSRGLDFKKKNIGVVSLFLMTEQKKRGKNWKLMSSFEMLTCVCLLPLCLCLFCGYERQYSKRINHDFYQWITVAIIIVYFFQSPKYKGFRQWRIGKYLEQLWLDFYLIFLSFLF